MDPSGLNVDAARPPHKTLAVYPTFLIDANGTHVTARVRGALRADGLWEGWIEFERENGTCVASTERETTQPKYTDLVYWANGLTAVYLEGAYERAVAGEDG